MTPIQILSFKYTRLIIYDPSILPSHAALRLFASYPHDSAKDIEQMIMNYCKQDNLEVACGGEIDFASLQAQERSSLSKYF